MRVALEVCRERESDVLKTCATESRERRVGNAKPKIESMEKQRLHRVGPLGGETHLVEHGECAIRV